MSENLQGGFCIRKTMENIQGLFDFSTETQTFSHDEFIRKFIPLFKSVLVSKFGTSYKAKISMTSRDINCGCPHCGDGSSSYKRRFHIYFQNYSYKCYNDCHKPFGSLYNLIHEYGLQYSFTHVELSHIKRVFEDFMKSGLAKTDKSIKVTGRDIIDKDGHISTQVPEVNDYAFPREEIMSIKHLREVRRSPALIDYLRKRAVITDKTDLYEDRLRTFAYNERYEDLYVFNLAKNMRDVIGVQIKHLSPKSRRRFTTMSWSKIWTDIFQLQPKDFEELSVKFDKISMIWNSLHIDFSRRYNILEGTFDAYFVDNSIACWGLSNFVYNKSAYYITDNTLLDMAGKKKSLELINGGYNTFLWVKFAEDFPDVAYTCKDINDIVRKFPNFNMNVLEKYFGNDEFDTLYI